MAGELARKHHAAFRWLALLGWRWRSVSHQQKERASRGMDFPGSGCHPSQRHWRPPLCSLPARCPGKPARAWHQQPDGKPAFTSKWGTHLLMSAPQGMWNFPDQGWNPCLLQWKHGVLLPTGLPGKSLCFLLNHSQGLSRFPRRKRWLPHHILHTPGLRVPNTQLPKPETCAA